MGSAPSHTRTQIHSLTHTSVARAGQEGQTRKAVLQHKAQDVELTWAKEELQRHRTESHAHLTELIRLRTELRQTKAEVIARASAPCLVGLRRLEFAGASC